MLYGDITEKIIASAIKIHGTLGNGFQEVIYQRAMEIEMAVRLLYFEREKVLPIYYEGKHIGTRRVDFFVEGKIMVELKAIIQLENVHLAQAKNYVVAYDFAKGLLINFGATSLQYKLIFNPKYNFDNSKIK